MEGLALGFAALASSSSAFADRLGGEADPYDARVIVGLQFK